MRRYKTAANEDAPDGVGPTAFAGASCSHTLGGSSDLIYSFELPGLYGIAYALIETDGAY
ncbi:hypothetical protein EON83_26875 [bacterium]|nr:MAG: hypothetical protein EON83_26875 [bacterium]